jgi:hypothetical protein
MNTDNTMALAQLRFFRNQMLKNTDNPWGVSDYSHPDKDKWIAYRQRLRDVTKTGTPYLDENNILQGVVWPTTPSIGDS